MKTTAYLINVSRGALIDEVALADAVGAGSIAGAALDVLVNEPPPRDNLLLGLRNVIITPHSAFYSEDAIRDVRERAATNVVRSLQGHAPEHVVNDRVLKQPQLRLMTRADDSPSSVRGA
jgi:D-3-phosphoglycerate dehydrogenase